MPLNLSLAGLDVDAHYNIVVGDVVVEPLIVMDFKNGVYQVDGVAANVADMLAEETSEGGYGPYSEADIQAGVGLVGPSGGSYPSFVGEAEERALGAEGTTCIYSVRLPTNSTYGFRVELLDWPDSITYYYSVLADRDVAPRSVLSDNNSEANGPAVTADDLHKVALTIIDGKIARSVDGGNVLAIDPAAAWTTTPNLLVLNCGVGVTLEMIAIYPAQADAELPGLSAL